MSRSGGLLVGAVCGGGTAGLMSSRKGSRNEEHNQQAELNMRLCCVKIKNMVKTDRMNECRRVPDPMAVTTTKIKTTWTGSFFPLSSSLPFLSSLSNNSSFLLLLSFFSLIILIVIALSLPSSACSYRPLLFPRGCSVARSGNVY